MNEIDQIVESGNKSLGEIPCGSPECDNKIQITLLMKIQMRNYLKRYPDRGFVVLCEECKRKGEDSGDADSKERFTEENPDYGD